MGQSDKHRLAFIDGLRGLAAIYVLAFHVIFSPQPTLGVPAVVGPIIVFGYSGVVLFFVVSAFSLCLTMPRHEASGRPLMSFALSRFFRIAPLFYVLVGYQVWRVHGNVDPAALFASLSLLFNLSPTYVSGLAWAGWTVGAEVLFYLAFPAIYAASGLKVARLTAFALIGVIISVAFSYVGAGDPVWTKFHSRSILTYLPAFLIGMLCFVAWDKCRSLDRRRLIGAAALSVGVVILGVRIYLWPRYGGSPRCIFDATAYGLILVGAGLVDLGILRAKVLGFYGRISYSVYLWHTVVIWILGKHLQGIYATDLPVGTKYVACFALTLGVTTVIATVTYFLIERPAELLGRRVFSWLQTSRRVAVAAE